MLLGGDKVATGGVSVATIKLSTKAASTLPVGMWYDSELTGFGLRIGATTRSYFIEYRPGAGGRRVSKKRVKIGSADLLSLDAARAHARAMLARVALGGDPAQAKTEERAAAPFSTVLSSFLEEHVKGHRKASTADYYEHIINKHLSPRIGTKPSKAISADDISSMHAEIGRESGKYMANRAVAVASAAFNWAKLSNPTTGLRKFREQGRERYLTDAEMERLGEALVEAETVGIPYVVDEDGVKAKHAPKAANRRTKYGPHVTGAIRLYLLTGCRLSEILRLEWVHVDEGRGLLFLPDSKTGQKTVVLSAAALDVLKSLPRVGRYVIASDSAGTRDEKPRHDVKKPWAAIRCRAGIEDVRVHDLRHSFASFGAGEDMGLPIIGKLLGHKNVRTTQRYAHVAVGPERRAADAIGVRVSGLLKGRGK